jgi:hypothetical protein
MGQAVGSCQATKIALISASLHVFTASIQCVRDLGSDAIHLGGSELAQIRIAAERKDDRANCIIQRNVVVGVTVLCDEKIVIDRILVFARFAPRFDF